MTKLDTKAFPTGLAKAIAAVLSRRRRKLAGRTLDCLAIDVHPWSGFLNLCMRLTDDEAPRSDGSRVLVADWELSSFAVAHYPKRARGAWPEASELARALKAAHSDKGRVSDDSFSDHVRALCARAARDACVWDSLRAFSRAPEFTIIVNDVDHPERSTTIKGPSRTR